MYLTPGVTLQNRYTIAGILGHGGFGVTYAAHDACLNVQVAIKEYLPRALATRGEGQTNVSVYSGEAGQQFDYGLRKFLEESQSVARFSHHPNIVSARDYFEANGTAYMVMEYVEGVTLKEYLAKKGGRIAFAEAVGIMMPVMDALREVHGAGLLHRDISPDNIYITSSKQVKVLDFGAARYFSGEQSKSLSIILKPGYAPEEQYRSSGKQGAWTDVYAVGATFYKVLTGQTPPDALDHKEEETLQPPSQLGVAILPAAEQALVKALAVNASQRFQNMWEFQQALLGGEPMVSQFQGSPTSFQPTDSPASQPVYHPRPTGRSGLPVTIGAGVLVLVLTAGVIWFFMGREDPGGKLLKQGMEYAKAQNYPQALMALEEAVRLSPGDARVNLQLARTYYELKRFPEGLKAYQEVLRIEPTQVEAHYQVGMAYVHQGKKDLAWAEYQLIKDKEPVEFSKQLFAAIDPPTTETVRRARELITKGIDSFKAKDYHKAQAELEKAVSLSPQEAEAHFYLGLTYVDLKRYPEAIDAYRQALKIKSDFPQAYLNLGAVYDKLDRPKEAIEAWKEAARIKPDYGLAYYNLATLYWHRGEKELAWEQYTSLQAKDTDLAKTLQEQIPDLAGAFSP